MHGGCDACDRLFYYVLDSEVVPLRALATAGRSRLVAESVCVQQYSQQCSSTKQALQESSAVPA